MFPENEKKVLQNFVQNDRKIIAKALTKIGKLHKTSISTFAENINRSNET
jgi:hypothetical protein